MCLPDGEELSDVVETPAQAELCICAWLLTSVSRKRTQVLQPARVFTHVCRGFDSMMPSLVTIPTPTLFADPSMPRAIFTSGIKTEGACGNAVPVMASRFQHTARLTRTRQVLRMHTSCCLMTPKWKSGCTMDDGPDALPAGLSTAAAGGCHSHHTHDHSTSMVQCRPSGHVTPAMKVRAAGPQVHFAWRRAIVSGVASSN